MQTTHSLSFSIETLGCKVNQYESQAISSLLCSHGYVLSPAEAMPEVFIVNSCTVTAQSDRKVRQLLNRARRENPACIIVLTGCMPQAFPEESAALLQADIVLGNQSRQAILPALEAFLQDGRRIVNILPHKSGDAFEESSIEAFENHTRAFIKIEDGCNRFCSYCIIPYARGRVRSKPLDKLLEEADGLALAGFKEFVLVGINLSAYGQDLGLTLLDAAAELSKLEGVERIRFGSLEPDLMEDELISELAKLPKLCPQFHLSLQSGCDETLKRMNRHYSCDDYRRVTAKIRQCFKNPSITTDIMVGFAGETDEEFAASLDFVQEIGFARTHVFAYSRRKGTKAYDLPNQLSNPEKERRSKLMIEAARKTALDFAKAQVGQSCYVLFEKEISPNTYEGYSGNYSIVHCKSEEDLRGRICKVLVTGADGVNLQGEFFNA
ncbi:MAG: tRNA (N(6)-L-threonylcarbamoyladenosine(37)-C(2))-methylthiotransferase MtaB [Oscillospiraceae bacterium]|jgi:threonylcarbamoyladenosine tRNA methylthiotransferase MtaB|nr:tRNA (N(6)-L-threonylcarbamoyladenosine(37)-C(2))-methylthiotransferase MtaB [Oscillospiraceae bacterium]